MSSQSGKPSTNAMERGSEKTPISNVKQIPEPCLSCCSCWKYYPHGCLCCHCCWFGINGCKCCGGCCDVICC